MNVGIIGGADGPTAVLVTSAYQPWMIIAGVCAVVCAVVALVVIIKKNK